MPALSITASGKLARPMYRLAWLLAQTARFQTLMGVGTAAAALDLIDFDEWSALNTGVSNFSVPGAIVSDFDELEHVVDPHSGHQHGELFLSIFDSVNATHVDSNGEGNRKDQIVEWRNTLSDIIDQMFTLQDTPDGGGSQNMLISGPIEKAGTPQLTHPDDPRDSAGSVFLTASFLIPWGT